MSSEEVKRDEVRRFLKEYLEKLIGNNESDNESDNESVNINSQEKMLLMLIQSHLFLCKTFFNSLNN